MNNISVVDDIIKSQKQRRMFFCWACEELFIFLQAENKTLTKI